MVSIQLKPYTSRNHREKMTRVHRIAIESLRTDHEQTIFSVNKLLFVQRKQRQLCLSRNKNPNEKLPKTHEKLVIGGSEWVKQKLITNSN